jgi:hypothetical protein
MGAKAVWRNFFTKSRATFTSTKVSLPPWNTKNGGESTSILSIGDMAR